MKPSSYREHDYAFGQLMLTLRSAIGLTQAGLAQALGVSRRSVADWEAGKKHPKAAHLKQFVALALTHQAFQAGHEADEIRALWKSAHQKEPLSEVWLSDLLLDAQVTRSRSEVERTPATDRAVAAPDARRAEAGQQPAVPANHVRRPQHRAGRNRPTAGQPGLSPAHAARAWRDRQDAAGARSCGKRGRRLSRWRRICRARLDQYAKPDRFRDRRGASNLLWWAIRPDLPPAQRAARAPYAAGAR